jgi:Zn-dependent protease
MSLSWKLGRVAGIDLFLHPSVLLLFVIGSHSMDTGLASAAIVVAFLGSIVLHELGHALMARRYGIQTADITLYLFGGVARLERMPRSSGPELLIALAGPAVNFAIVAVLGTIIGLSRYSGLGRYGELGMIPLLENLAYINLILGAFNLLPVFPMDGGRVLRALLSSWVGRVKATEVAAGLGRILAMVGGLYFLMNGMYLSIALAVFVYIAGSMELQQVRMERRGSALPEGFINAPEPPAGFRWANRGDGVWRLVPVMVHSGWRDQRSWN